MEVQSRAPSWPRNSEEEMYAIRKGSWTAEEDSLLFNYVNIHGEGQWNSVAPYAAGLRRTGKSCRLRWLNYLRPNVRRGNITLQEQLLILQLHFQYGNRWSKIAQYLPGRTDNEVKNYWRTRVQKHAKQLNCDVNSQQFRDTLRIVWIPRLIERIRASSPEPFMGEGEFTNTTRQDLNPTCAVVCNKAQLQPANICLSGNDDPKFMLEISSGSSPDSLNTQQKSDLTDSHNLSCQDSMQAESSWMVNTWSSCWDDMHAFESDMHAFGFEKNGSCPGSVGGDTFMDDCLWNGDDNNNQGMLFLQQHLYCD